ncbi:hypothetical protein C8Q77DRAFT_1064323 [Trametes polyzona]|nr:hypothetical protein C8Q77DRAFT_1064323 [Trametes polyzona]
MFSAKFAAIFTALVAVVTTVSAAPADVVNPPITSPKAGDVWTVGTEQTVSWDTSSIVNPTDETGLLLLGFLEGNSTNEHLDTRHPLASGFKITTGSVHFKVPDVIDRNDYIVVLFGDSGNESPKFSITH